MINRIYSTVKFFSNNQMQGNVTPTEFNLALYNRINEVYESYFFDINRITNRENRGLITNGHADIPKKLAEKINHYLKTGLLNVVTGGLSANSNFNLDTGYIVLPDDHRYTDLLINNDNNRVIDETDDISRFFSVNTVKHTQPSSKFPIAIRNGSQYAILPNTINQVRIAYLRKPLEPNWTYTVVDGVELYNPSNPSFQDVDMHPSEEFNLTLLVLKSFGVNLKEEQLLQAANSEEMKEFQKQNSL